MMSERPNLQMSDLSKIVALLSSLFEIAPFSVATAFASRKQWEQSLQVYIWFLGYLVPPEKGALSCVFTDEVFLGQLVRRFLGKPHTITYSLALLLLSTSPNRFMSVDKWAQVRRRNKGSQLPHEKKLWTRAPLF